MKPFILSAPALTLAASPGFFRSGETAGKPVGEIAVTAEGGSATVESLDVYELKSIREK